ncbi:MAG: hypothetical protein ABJI60_07400 [Kangiellaceae bacterium]
MYSPVKIFVQSALVVALALSIACGGSSGSNPDPQPPFISEPKPAFSLTLRQQTTCQANAVLPGVSVLVYQQSPLLNYDTPFELYKTDSNGLLELDVPADSKVSFSINTKTAAGSSKVYTFNELEADDYDFTVLFFDESELQADCKCETVAFDAELNTGTNLSEIENKQLYWGNGLNDYTVNTSDRLSFTDVELCGTEHEQLPVAVRVSSQFDGPEFYGYKASTEALDFSTPINIDSTVVELNKPDLGEDYQVASWKVVEGYNYFYSLSTTEAPTYKTFPNFLPGKSQFDITQYIPATFNGEPSNAESFSEGASMVRASLEGNSIEMMDSVPSAQFIDMEYDIENRRVIIVSDGPISEAHLNYTYIRNIRPNGELFRWYIYSPNSQQISLPLLEEPYESEFLEGDNGSALRLSSYVRVNNANSFSDALTIRRFNDLNSGRRTNEFSESLIEVYYRKFAINQQLIKSEMEKLEAAKGRSKNAARDLYYR